MSKKKSSNIVRQNIWQNYLEDAFESDYEKCHHRQKTNQKFIINENYIKNRPLLNSENFHEYYQYNDCDICSNHKQSKNNSCHLVQVPICYTTSHGFVAVNTIHGIRLKHSDIITKKTSRHKVLQKNVTPLLTNITTATTTTKNCSKHINGSMEHSRSGKLFMIPSHQQALAENSILCKNNERNWPHIMNGKNVQITESIKSLRKKSNDRKSTINESHKNSNCFEKVKSMKTSKITDRDVIFGNARLVLRKRNYGWEKSRIEWLLELERKNAA